MRNSLANGCFRLAPVVAIVVLLGACTTTTITPELVQPAPEQKIDTVVVADLTSEDELLNPGLVDWQPDGQKFRLWL